jgi:hypothetical protein
MWVCDVHLWKSYVYGQARDDALGTAEKLLVEATSLQPGNDSALVALAQLYARMGETGTVSL